MDSPLPRSTATLFGRPLYRMLAPFSFTCFVGTLATDIAYAFTADMQWANMSAWLLTAGLGVLVVAIAAGLIDFFGQRRGRALRGAWSHGLGNLLAFGLSTLNILVHSRDGYTSVVPLGLALSVLVVAILAVAGWHSWDRVYRDRVGVGPRDRS